MYPLKENLRELLEAGKTYREIATHLGIAHGSVVAYVSLYQLGGISKHKAKSSLSSNDILEILNLSKTLSANKIGEKLNIPAKTILRVIHSQNKKGVETQPSETLVEPSETLAEPPKEEVFPALIVRPKRPSIEKIEKAIKSARADMATISKGYTKLILGGQK